MANCGMSNKICMLDCNVRFLPLKMITRLQNAIIYSLARLQSAVEYIVRHVKDMDDV